MTMQEMALRIQQLEQKVDALERALCEPSPKNVPSEKIVQLDVIIPFDVVESPTRQGRFIIVRKDNGATLDDAQGYGYKSADNAGKAGWYKFGGGKAKQEQNRK